MADIVTFAVNIGGSPHPAALQLNKLSWTRALGKRSLGRISFTTSTLPLAGLALGNTIDIKIDGAIELKGRVDRLRQRLDPSASQLSIEVELGDGARIFDRRVVAAAFTNQELGTILDDIFDVWFSGVRDESVTKTNSPARGAGPTIAGKIVFDYIPMTQILNQIAKETGWMWYFDPASFDLHFEDPGTASAAPFTITDAVPNCSMIALREDRASYANAQLLKTGASFEQDAGALVESFNGDDGLPASSPSDQFVMTFSFSGSAPLIWINEIAVLAGDIGTLSDFILGTAKKWYFIQNFPHLLRGSLQAPLIATDQLRVQYTTSNSGMVYVVDSAEVTVRQTAEGGSGIYEAFAHVPDVTELTYAGNLATELIAIKALSKDLEFETTKTGLRPGQIITVTRADLGLSAVAFLIQDCSYDLQWTKDPTLRTRVRATDVSKLIEQGWPVFFDELIETAKKRVTPDGAAASGSPPTGSGSSIVVLPLGVKTLSATPLVVPDPVGIADSTILVYIWKQDGTGSRTVVWPSSFTDTIQPEIDANRASIMWFFKESATLIYPCVPALGGVKVV